ncbi:MAG: SOS response-associated peptidase [Planctomycetes bacterium]|nr:SOS response-associated peptidase [Planctomycetota bacterium]
MCGRFTLRTPPDVLMEAFDVAALPEFPLRYNIAPTHDVLIVRANGPDREAVLVRWGLIPFWAKEVSIGSRMINARSESVSEKPAFRVPFQKRRCLVVADGYYEWRAEGARKQPFLIHGDDDRPFAMAGLWDRWTGSEPPTESCTIITTDSNAATRAVHDRMPVILDARDYPRWLDPDFRDTERLAAMLIPNESMAWRVDPVSSYVNNVRNQGPRCVEP